MQQTITVPARFRGPPQSANGGYIAGIIAEQFAATEDDGAATAIEVTLRAPIPLDQPMTLSKLEGEHMALSQGETLIAEAARTSLKPVVPEPPGFQAALECASQSPSFAKGVNPFIPDGTGFHPVCFCCGADVAPDQGLHVYAAPVDGFDGVAAAWRPHERFADADGNLPQHVLWAAMDCPGQFAYYAAGIRTGLLGRMTASVLKPVAADQDLRVIGWREEVERRKHFAGTALFDESGDLCGYSRQVWIGRMD